LAGQLVDRPASPHEQLGRALPGAGLEPVGHVAENDRAYDRGVDCGSFLLAFRLQRKDYSMAKSCLFRSRLFPFGNG
jgi:hypothetical protein